MKTLDLKIALTTLVITLCFSVSFFAKGLEFKIRIDNPDKQLVIGQLQDNFPLRFYDEYADVGSFEDYLMAMKNQYEIESNGFENTSIVAFFNLQQITLDDAFVLLDNRNDQDQQSETYMSESQMDLALKMVQNEEFYYAIQIGIFSEESVNKFFEFPKAIDESITPKGYYRYTYGKFKTLQDAKDALVMLQENYFESAFIIAFDELERIPLASAIEKEKRLLEESIAQVNP